MYVQGTSEVRTIDEIHDAMLKRIWIIDPTYLHSQELTIAIDTSPPIFTLTPLPAPSQSPLVAIGKRIAQRDQTIDAYPWETFELPVILITGAIAHMEMWAEVSRSKGDICLL